MCRHTALRLTTSPFQTICPESVTGPWIAGNPSPAREDLPAVRGPLTHASKINPETFHERGAAGEAVSGRRANGRVRDTHRKLIVWADLFAGLSASSPVLGTPPRVCRNHRRSVLRRRHYATSLPLFFGCGGFLLQLIARGRTRGVIYESTYH